MTLMAVPRMVTMAVMTRQELNPDPASECIYIYIVYIYNFYIIHLLLCLYI